jgi:hypothetical protein
MVKLKLYTPEKKLEVKYGEAFLTISLQTWRLNGTTFDGN